MGVLKILQWNSNLTSGFRRDLFDVVGDLAVVIVRHVSLAVVRLHIVYHIAVHHLRTAYLVAGNAQLVANIHMTVTAS